MAKTLTLQRLAQHLQGELRGAGAYEISGPGTIQAGRPGEIGFLDQSHYRHFLADSRLGAIIVREPLDLALNQIIVGDVKRAWRQTLELFKPELEPATISPQALLADNISLGKEVAIGAGAVLEAGVKLGDRVRVAAGAILEADVTVGPGTQIGAGAKLLRKTVVGANCLIGPGAVIGSRGFGLNFEAGRWREIPQLGGVTIGDEVEIGACTTIDCGAVRDTVLEEGVKLDNHIQIGHNVHIGAHTIMAGCSVVAGSVRFGRYCVVGGACVFAGHIEICDGAQFTGHSSISKSITTKGLYSSGFPAVLDREWKRFVVKLRILTRD